MRKCRECGELIGSEWRVYGRQSVRGEWWVHTDSGRVPCCPLRRAAFREAAREAGQTISKKVLDSRRQGGVRSGIEEVSSPEEGAL